jgi:hypothetical protein
MASFDFNNNVDQDGMPNQAAIGLGYTAPMDGDGGDTTVTRKGVVTLLCLTGNLTASRNLNLDPDASWLPGDIVFITAPTHTGGAGPGYSLAVNDTLGNQLVDWPGFVANGGMFVFGANATSDDFCAALPGTQAPPPN